MKHGTVRKLSSQEGVVLVEGYRAGATMIELAEQGKVHRTTVSAHLRRPNQTLPGYRRREFNGLIDSDRAQSPTA